MQSISTEDLLSYTEDLLNHVHYFEHNLSLKPDKNHRLTAIKYTDIKERREDFLAALVNTVNAWVYSKKKNRDLFEERFKKTKEVANAANFVTTLAFRKFRPGYPQGQFGELLLFNFLQHFFRAAPLLRKQRITTNINNERNGADAIHYRLEGQTNVLFLGESKCYESKYQFSAAFKKSLESINNTFKDFDRELDQYVFDDFIDPDLLKVAMDFKEGVLDPVRIEMVCLVAYQETEKLKLTQADEIHKSIVDIVVNRCGQLVEKDYDVCKDILSRIHFIIFPIWKLDELLDNFQKKVGSE